MERCASILYGTMRVTIMGEILLGAFGLADRGEELYVRRISTVSVQPKSFHGDCAQILTFTYSQYAEDSNRLSCNNMSILGP